MTESEFKKKQLEIASKYENKDDDEIGDYTHKLRTLQDEHRETMRKISYEYRMELNKLERQWKKGKGLDELS